MDTELYYFQLTPNANVYEDSFRPLYYTLEFTGSAEGTITVTETD